MSIDPVASRLYYSDMDAELNQLEVQIEQLITLYESIKMENRELRARVAKLEAENRVLTEKVDYAVEKFDSMLNRITES